MTATVRTAPFVVWLVLVAGTFASLVVGTDMGLHDRDAVACALLTVAFVKVYLVGRYFMELHAAAPMLRRAFAAYVVIVGGTLVGLAVAL